MRAPRRTIERRLFNAVMLVLAGAGCQPPAAAVGDTGPDPTRTGGASSDAGVATSSTTSYATPPADAGPRVPALAQAEVDALCAAYKQTSRVDGKTAKRQPHHGEQPVADTGYWNPSPGVAQCTIVHQHVAEQIEVMRSPTCCPQGMNGRPCPPAYKTKVPAVRQLVEHVQVRADGTPGTRTVSWMVTETMPERRHNCGRRPEGLRLGGATAPGDGDDVGAQLAAMAELEAASVPAFERLAHELASHGAPAELVRRARAAMRDEVRHARVTSELAARSGCVPRTIEVAELPCRDLAAIARENATEGCVREAYGALIATYQAERAAPALRAAFRAIAADERRHAGLAEDVHAWIMARLDEPSREAITAARRATEDELRASLAAAPACPPLGLPGGDQAVALFDAYFVAAA